MKLLFTGIALLVFQTIRAQSYSIAQLRQQLTEAAHDTVRMRLYNELAHLYARQIVPDSAYYLATRGRALARQYGQIEAEAKSIFYIGYFHKRKSQYAKAQSYYEAALRLSTKHGLLRLRTKLLYSLSTVSGDQGMYQKAIEYATASLQLAEQIKDSVQQSNAYVMLTLAYMDVKNMPKALMYARWNYKLAQQIVARHPDKELTLLSALSAIVDTYEANGRFAAAYPYRKKALAYYLANQETDHVTEEIMGLGKNLVAQQRPREAIQLINESLKRKRLLHPDTYTYEIFALAYKQLGQPKLALYYAKRAYQFSKYYGNLKQIRSSLNTLIATEESQQRYADALTHLRQLNTISDSLFTLDKTKALAQVEARYQVAQQEATIQLLRKDAALRKITLAQNKEELTNQQQRQAMLTLFALLLLVSVVSLFAVFRREQTTARLLSVQKADIEDKANQLQAANALKDNLFTIIGHDLRSPIASLKAQLTGIKEGFVSPDEFSARVSLLSQKVDSVYTTLDNLLHFSLLQQKGLRSFLTQVDLAETIESVVQLYDAEIRAKQLMVHKTYNPTLVWADEHQLHIIGRNILQNAIKFTPVGGSIHLITRRQNDYAVLLIKDSGVGMETSQPADQANLNLSTRGTAGEHGTGLGLRICRELVQLNKGQLHIESTPGQGTTVSVGFPEYQPAALATTAFLQ